MNIELPTIERSSNEQHHYDESDTISNTSRSHTASHDDNEDTSKELNIISKQRYAFLLTISI